MSLLVRHERPCLTTFPNAVKRVDIKMCNRLFLKNFMAGLLSQLYKPGILT